MYKCFPVASGRAETAFGQFGILGEKEWVNDNMPIHSANWYTKIRCCLDSRQEWIQAFALYSKIFSSLRPCSRTRGWPWITNLELWGFCSWWSDRGTGLGWSLSPFWWLNWISFAGVSCEGFCLLVALDLSSCIACHGFVPTHGVKDCEVACAWDVARFCTFSCEAASWDARSPRWEHQTVTVLISGGVGPFPLD